LQQIAITKAAEASTPAQTSKKTVKVEIDQLTNIDDRWARAEALETLKNDPAPENLALVEQSINVLLGKDFKPYRKQVEPVDSYTACQMILQYAKTDVFRTDPYAVQAMIPFVGNQADFLSRQLRAMENGLFYFAIYQLLEAQLAMSK